MDSHSLILVLIISAIAVVSTQEALESFRLCIVDQGLPPDLIVVYDSTENSTLYAELDYRWNIRPVHRHPLAYFVPRVTSDVQVAVRCARANNIPVIPKSGGHSAELLSYVKTGTIVITLYMKKIQINASEKTAVIEPGALLREIHETLLNEGGFGLATGSCDYVGIGGIALGGGEAYTSSINNLTVDNILEMEMVDSNGDLQLVNENVNTDLFWALRGVGPGYIGIVTSFKFKLFNATDIRTTFVSFSYDLEMIGSVFLAFKDFLVSAEKDGFKVFNTFTVAGATSRITVGFRLIEEISNGQPTNAESFFNKINETFPPLEGQQLTLTFPSYTELRSDWKSIEFPSINTEPATYQKKKSFFVSRTASAEELENMMQTYQRARNLHVLILHFGYTGLVNKIPATDMSYAHRGKLYQVSPRVVANPEVSVEEAQLAHIWLNEYETVSKVIDSGESYQNYVDLDLSDNFMDRYYGVNSERLMEIKRKWDPHNYFQSELSIPIANMATKRLIMLPTSFICLCLLNVIKHYFAI